VDKQRAKNQVNARIEPHGESKVEVTATLTTIWQTQYRPVPDTAKKLRDDGHHAAAIVTAQTACEVCTELVLTDVLRTRGVERLTKPLDDLLPRYNLANDKVRNLYVALSSDRIQDQPFWPSVGFYLGV